MANHVSFLDILVLASVRPFVFVTTEELRRYLFLGFLARLGESVFIERRNRAALREDIDELADVLRQGFDLMLFPEGTSFDGRAVRPFKTPFFAAAARAGAAVTPYALNYRAPGGGPLSRVTADRVFWYEGVHFKDQAWNFLTIPGLVARVDVFADLPADGDGNRKRLANEARARIVGAFEPVL